MEPKDLKKPEGLENKQTAGKTKPDKGVVVNEERVKPDQVEDLTDAVVSSEVSGSEKETETAEVNEPLAEVLTEKEDLANEAKKEKTSSEDADPETVVDSSPEVEIPVETGKTELVQETAEIAGEENAKAEPEVDMTSTGKNQDGEPVAESETPGDLKPVEIAKDEAGEEGKPEIVGTTDAKTDREGEGEGKAPSDVNEKAEKSEPVGEIKNNTLERQPELQTATEKTNDEPDSGAEEIVAAPAFEKEKTEKPASDKPAQVSAKREKPDYSTFSQIELVNALRELLNTDTEHDIRDEVETIRATFYRLVKDENDAQRKQFLEDGGAEEEFHPEENPYEQDINDLLKQYRQLRHEFNKKLEHEKELNLQQKYEIIEEIKGLIHKEESINKTFQDFRELQQRWREIGLVPQAKMKDLWDTYHFHVENFYDYIKINKELRDLDLKKNLEMKIRLCEQAEELLLETNTVRAFSNLQKLHERWREIGPLPRENKDDIWERFKSATTKINKKHQDYFENKKLEQKKNLEAKRALCEQVEEINEMDLATYQDWAEKSKEMVNLQKVWRTIGFAPRKDNNRIYKRFRDACDRFFDAKREFYGKNKELQQNNLQMKMDLCLQVEALKDSEDWRKTTQDLINIQKQWKEIGPVPRKQSDLLWKRFRAACDYFFNKKSEHFSGLDNEQEVNLKEKEQLIKEVESFKSTGDVDENLHLLKDIQRRWTEIGHVPIKVKDDIQKRFRDAINKLFDDLNLDESKRNLLKFRTKMASFHETSRGQNKMRLERDKYMTKLKQLENDLVLLDNNIGFFAKSKNAETLIKDVKRQIEQTREKIEVLKDKIRVIDDMDQSED